MLIISNHEQLNHALGNANKTQDAETLIREKQENLAAFISFGAQLAQLERDIPSTKVRGNEIAKRFPQSQSMDPAKRSHCKWLYRALHEAGHPAGDIHQVLGLRSIMDICKRTDHPTVINKMYLRAKAKAA